MKYHLALSIVVALILLGVVFYVSNIDKTLQKQVSDLNNTNTILRNVFIVGGLGDEAYAIEDKAKSYYSEAGFSYENGDYKNTESNCRLARGYYSDASQEYLVIVSKLKSLNLDNEIMDLEIKRYNLASEMDLNMYEACEHLESASRYYDIYFNTNVSYSDTSFDMGGKEISSMNEKIAEHDANVREYNKVVSDLRIKIGELK